MKWLWFAGLIVVIGGLLRGFMRSEHLRNANSENNNWRTPGSGGGGLGMGS
jgi:hypothetical protein